MASVFRRANSPYWFAAYRGARNERCKKTTKRTDEGQAFDMAKAWEEAARAGKERTLTENQVRKVIGEIVEKAMGSPLKFYTVRDWFEAWLSQKEKVIAGTSYAAYESPVKQFLAHLGGRSKLSIEAITPKDIQGFRDSQTSRGLSPRTCNNKLKNISQGFNAAFKQGLITHNPCFAVEALRAEEGEQFRKPFTAEQLAKILEGASTEWRGAILIAAFTGARIGDAARMQWESIDLVNKVIEFKPRKVRRGLPGSRPKKVKVPIHPELEDYLLSLPSPKSKTSKVPVFPELAKMRVGGITGLSLKFVEIINAAEVKRTRIRKAKGKSGRNVYDLGFHSLRYYFNSLMANHGVSQEIRQAFTGHSSADVNDIYTKFDGETLRRSIDALPGILS